MSAEEYYNDENPDHKWFSNMSVWSVIKFVWFTFILLLIGFGTYITDKVKKWFK